MSCIYTHPRDAPRKPLEATNSVTLHDARSTHGHYVFMPALNNLKGKIIKQFQALKKMERTHVRGREDSVKREIPEAADSVQFLSNSNRPFRGNGKAKPRGLVGWQRAHRAERLEKGQWWTGLHFQISSCRNRSSVLQP